MPSVMTWVACGPPGSESTASTQGFTAYLGDLTFSAMQLMQAVDKDEGKIR